MRVNIKNLRKDHGVLQSDLAQILGLTQSSISRIESEGLELTKRQFDLLCDRYGADEVSQYIVKDSPINITIPKEKDIKDLSGIIKLLGEQHDSLCEIVQNQQEWINKYATLNERLLTVIEKITMK